jgi:hypothetical protein
VGQFNFKLYVHILINLAFGSLICAITTIFGVIWNSNDDGFVIAGIAVRLILATFILYESVRLLINFVKYIENNQSLIETYKQVRGKKMKVI